MTMNCEHCREYLLDHVYGLLEGADLQGTIAHLAACDACRAALAKVKTEQKLLARAAKPITLVPEFTLPIDGSATVPLETAVRVTPEMLPYPQVPAAKRSLWRRPWVAWVAAAAIVLAVLTPVIGYRAGLRGYQADVASARKAQQDVEIALAALPAKSEPQHKKAIDTVRAKASPHLHVVGPRTLEPNAKAHLDITTRHPEGDLLACHLTIKLLEANQVVKVVRLESEGHARAEIDAAGVKPNTALTLLVEAEARMAHARFQETVHVQEPSYVTRLDTSKLLYQSYDVLFFRVLVLDRYTLQPPSQPIPLNVVLRHGKTAVRTLQGATGVGGILAAEFAVEETFPEGSYTLDVTPIEAAKTGVMSISTPLEVVRALPGIRLDQNRYAAGKSVTGVVTVPGNQPVPSSIVGRLDGKPIPITLQPQSALAGFGGAGAGNAPKKGLNQEMAARERQFRFATPPIPPSAAKGALMLTMPVPNDAKKQELGTVIPLEPTEFAIDFFPEGGDLVAGVQNRVFYRVRSRTGEPIAGEGQVILLTGKNEVVDSSYTLGMGYFDFVPDRHENYTVRITTPTKIEHLAPLAPAHAVAAGVATTRTWAPFGTLGIRREGVVLQVADAEGEHAPRAVGVQGDPIRVTLRRQGPPVKLFLVAHCRGQIVDQRWVELKKEPVDVTLQPTHEAHGVIRVTAYELTDDTLEPIAERLVYRAPTGRLDLGFTPIGAPFQPGRTTAYRVAAIDETGKSAPAWVLASVIDERFQSKPRSLSAHFLLLNDVRTGADLDGAQLVLNDATESRAILERYLGTHGWRRYVPAAAQGIAFAANQAPNDRPDIFSQPNVRFVTLQKQYQEQIAQALTPIRIEAFKEQERLQNERTDLVAAVNILVGQLHNFETQVQIWIRVALGTAVMSLLFTSLILMGVGAYRTIRGHKAATPAFGSAFACLAACLAVYFSNSLLGAPESAAPTLIADQKGGGPDRVQLEDRLARAPTVRVLQDEAPMGNYSLRARGDFAEAHQKAADADRKGGEAEKTDVAKTLRTELVMNWARPRDEAARRGLQFNENRFEAALPTPPDAKALKESKSKGALAQRKLEYPYQHSPSLPGDTLLWHPTLFLPDGTAQVSFGVAPGEAATFRVLLLGHNASGRFGFFETRLDVPAFPGR